MLRVVRAWKLFKPLPSRVYIWFFPCLGLSSHWEAPSSPACSTLAFFLGGGHHMCDVACVHVKTGACWRVTQRLAYNSDQ